MTALVIDAQGHECIVCQLIRHPRFGVERIGIILQQRCPFDVPQRRSASCQRFYPKCG